MAKKTVKSTGLANFTQAEGAMDVIAILQEELKNIKRETESPWLAGDSLPLGGSNLNIRNETNLPTLVNAALTVEGYFQRYDSTIDKYAEALKGQNVQRKLGGFTQQAWEADLKKQMKTVSIKDREAKLTKVLEQSKKFLSERDQFQIFLAEAASLVGATPIEEVKED